MHKFASCLPAIALFLGLLTSYKAVASPWTEGKKRLLYIRVDFSDKPGEPISEVQIQEVMQQVNDFYANSSSGKFSIKTTITPVLRAPQTAEWYLQHDAREQIQKDGRAAAKAAGFSLGDFDLEIVAFAQLGEKGGGSGLHGRKGLYLDGAFSFSVTAHEIGHNLGLYHANAWKTNDGSILGEGRSIEYGNPFDLMGSTTLKTSSHSYFSAWEKFLLDWLPPEEVQDVTTIGTYRLHAQDTWGNTGIKALRIKKDADKNYWIEFRQSRQDNYFAYNGVIIYWGLNTPDKSQLLDMTPDSPGGAKDAPLLIGRTFVDPGLSLYITPIGKVPLSAVDVVVNIGPFKDNRPPALTLEADTLHVMQGGITKLKATGRDPDGDTLAYSWESSDGDFGGNQAAIEKRWNKLGTFIVRCTVTDMKGGTRSKELTVEVQ